MGGVRNWAEVCRRKWYMCERLFFVKIWALLPGILKLRYHGLKDEISKQKDEIKGRFEKEKNLYEQIQILEKDIEG